MRRVLALRRGGLGDTLLMLPLLRALRAAHAGATVALAGVREFAQVLARFGAVDEAISSEALALWAPDRAREHLRRFDLVVGDEPTLAHVALDPTRVRPGVPFALQLVQQAGLACDWPAAAQLLPVRPSAGGEVALAPGSGGRAKCWPRPRWLELAAALAAAGRRLCVVVGPAEQERDDPRGWQWPAGTAFFADGTPVQLAERLLEVGLYVGNDSGPTHLAAMLGVPTVALFGPSDPAVWAPVGEHVVVLTAAEVATVVDAVQRAASTRCQ